MTELWLRISEEEIISGIEVAPQSLGLWSREPCGQMEESIGPAHPPGNFPAVFVELFLEILQ